MKPILGYMIIQGSYPIIIKFCFLSSPRIRVAGETSIVFDPPEVHSEVTHFPCGHDSGPGNLTFRKKWDRPKKKKLWEGEE